MKILLLILLFPAFAFAFGHETGNGGDAYAIEFVNLAQKISFYLASSHASRVDLQKLEQAITQTKVESTDQTLSLNGVPKDAINFPKEGRILFNRGRWTQMELADRPALVLHEYLSLLGIEDANYTFSKDLLGVFRYDGSSLACKTKDGHGTIDIGPQSATGGIQPQGQERILGVMIEDGTSSNIMPTVSALLAKGTFSQSILDGTVIVALGNDLVAGTSPLPDAAILSVFRPIGSDVFDGFFSQKGVLYPIGCEVQ